MPDAIKTGTDSGSKICICEQVTGQPDIHDKAAIYDKNIHSPIYEKCNMTTEQVWIRIGLESENIFVLMLLSFDI